MSSLITSPEGQQCFLCLRVTPKQILEVCHKLWSKEIAHEIGIKTAEIIKEIYLKKPTYFCGRSSKSIIGSILYILQMVSCFDLEHRSQREICEVLHLTPKTLRSGYKELLWNFVFEVVM